MQENSFHINTFPREILFEVFRYITQLSDRHNAMLVCKYWYEILQDPCFMHTCSEILTMKYYDVSPNCELVQIFFYSNRQFNQICLNGLSWEDTNEQFMQEFVKYVARNARIVFHNHSLEWQHYFLLFPKMMELRLESLESIKDFEKFPHELNTVVVKSIDPKEVDLEKPIFKQIRVLKSFKTFFKIVPEEKIETGLKLELDEEVKIHLTQICDLKSVKIATGSNLLRNEPLTFRDIIKLVITEPVLVKIEHLSAFSKLRDFRVDYNEDPSNRTASCKFIHEVFLCPSVKKVSFELPRGTEIDFCKTCFETMLKSFPNLQRLHLENGQYSNRAMLLTLIDKYCPSLRTLKLLHKLSPHDHAILLPDGSPILGILNNLEKIHLYNLVLDHLRDWPMLPQLTAVTFIFIRFPEQISSWKSFVSNSPKIKKLQILSRFGLVETQDPIPSHRHIEEIVKGLDNLQDLVLRFNKLTPESLEPIFTYNRSLKNITLSTMGTPTPIFKLEHVFELFKRLPRLETFALKFIYFENGQYCEKYHRCYRWDYQSPSDHLKEAFYNYRDVRATIAYMRAFLMPHDRNYKGAIHSLGCDNVDDINEYLEEKVVTIDRIQ